MQAIGLVLVVLAALPIAHRTALLYTLGCYGLLIVGLLAVLSAPIGAWSAGSIKLGYVDIVR